MLDTNLQKHDSWRFYLILSNVLDATRMFLLLRRCNFTRGVMRSWVFGARLWTTLVAFTKYANIFSSVQQLDQVSGTPWPGSVILICTLRSYAQFLAHVNMSLCLPLVSRDPVMVVAFLYLSDAVYSVLSSVASHSYASKPYTSL